MEKGERLMAKTMKKLVSLGLCVSMGAALAACGGSGSSNNAGTSAQTQGAAQSEGSSDGSAAASDDTPVKLRMASVVSQNELNERKTGMAAGLMTWIDTVQQESGGSITIDLYPDSQLASGTDAIVNGITSGAFEVAHFTTSNWGEYSNAFAELTVPYLFSNYDEVDKILEGDIGQQMKDRLEQDVSGIKPLTYLFIGFRNVTASKPVQTVDDMKGLKIRTMNDKLQIAAMEAMGCAVTSVPISELYSALQTKMVDAEENPLSTIYSNKFYEVNPYCCLTNHSYTSTFVFMNKDVYDKLSDNQKAAVEKANEAAMKASKDAAAVADDEYEKLLTDAGMTIYAPTDEEMKGFQDAASSCWDQAKEIMGQERYDALMKVLGK